MENNQFSDPTQSAEPTSTQPTIIKNNTGGTNSKGFSMKILLLSVISFCVIGLVAVTVYFVSSSPIFPLFFSGYILNFQPEPTEVRKIGVFYNLETKINRIDKLGKKTTLGTTLKGNISPEVKIIDDDIPVYFYDYSLNKLIPANREDLQIDQKIILSFVSDSLTNGWIVSRILILR